MLFGCESYMMLVRLGSLGRFFCFCVVLAVFDLFSHCFISH